MCPRIALERSFPKSRITESRIIILLLSRDPRISSEIIRTRSFLHRLLHNACVNIFGYFLKIMCPRTALERSFSKSGISESRIIILLFGRDPTFGLERLDLRSCGIAKTSRCDLKLDRFYNTNINTTGKCKWFVENSSD